MTDLIDTRNVGAISALTRAMANAITPSNVCGASLQLQDLRITFAAPPPVAVLLGTAVLVTFAPAPEQLVFIVLLVASVMEAAKCRTKTRAQVARCVRTAGFEIRARKADTP